MVKKVLLIHFVMKCSMWMVVVSFACLKDLGLINSQSIMQVKFRSAQYRINQIL